jgi:hypothetical protein
MSSESALVRDMLNSISTIKFRIDQPGENRLLLKQRAGLAVHKGSLRLRREYLIQCVGV